MLITFCLSAPRATAAEQIEKSIHAGESFLIKDISPGSKPQVSFKENPNCFEVQNRSASEALVLASEAGEGSITVDTDRGKTVFHVKIDAVANAHDRLAPGSIPPPLSESRLSGDREKPASGSGSSTSSAAPAKATAPVPASKEASVAYASMTSSTPAFTKAAPSYSPPAAPSLMPVAYVPPSSGALAPARPSQAAASLPIGGKYTNNPPALEPSDSMAREPSIAGRHYLPNDAISMMGGTSRVYDFRAPLRRVSIADTKVADVQVINPNQLMVIGHSPGFTTLVVWDAMGQYQERQVRIEKEGHQQVLLDVVVAEVNRSKLETEGIDYSVALKDYGLSLAGLPGNVASAYGPASNLAVSGAAGTSSGGLAPFGGNPFPLLLSNNITYALTAQNRHLDTNTFFQFLELHQLGRILARPRILANSGEEAKFLSGGEIPIVIAQALNTSVVFKQFGTSVVFLPTVIGKQDIELVVKPEVSKPDFSQGVQLFGFTVPAFVTRRAETQVRMRENQTLIIAGLILDETKSQVKKVPFLGDIPWAGALFRNTSYDHVKTELVMSVTPTIVQPIPESGELELPTDRGPLSSQEIQTTSVSPPDASRPRPW
jgi:pilus assembly protein CpaC